MGVKASVVGYGVLALAAALTFRLLLLIGEVDAATFLEHEATASLLHPKAQGRARLRWRPRRPAS